MVWNVQGTGNKNKINAIKEVVRTYRPTVLVLLETHKDGVHAENVRRILGYTGHARVDAIGFSGGIWLYWHPDVVSVSPVTHHNQFITVEIARRGSPPWFFSAVYASPNPHNRHELWSELENYAHSHNLPWMLAGDFNETRSIQERHGGDQNMIRRCNAFNNWIEDCELIELEFSGPLHTWARGNSIETRQSARLDRALCNSEWGALFGDASVKHLPAYQSDHCPPPDFAKRWVRGDDLVKQLSNLSSDLQKWNKEVFGNIFRKKRELLARIEGCQRHLSIARTSNIIKLEAKLRRELDEVLEREELLWYQKYRVDFIRDGDRNTSFFHGVDDGSADIPYDIFQEFSNEHWEWLNKSYSQAEIERAIFDMGSLKAPVPDGFQALFYQKHWPVVKDDVCAMVTRALEGKGLPEGMNDTNIVLIPKVSGPEYVSQFRPISLCNVAYKIVSKVLANRIKKVLPRLISENQSGFVPGRQISDNIIVFQETIHTMRRKKGKKAYMAIKIDLEKAYDRLRWSFIENTLKDMYFPQLLVDTIMNCVTSTRMQVLWNGEPTEKFIPTRGVRQGDPLSSYLFVMCLEKLQQAIDERVRKLDWLPIPICKGGPKISNLFFADDMVLFAEARADQAHVIKYVLDNFCLASGEKEELQKIAAYTLSPEPYMEDTLHWNGTTHGQFSIKSALAIIRSHDDIPVNNFTAWPLIWKLPVQQRIRFFIWLSAHDRVMTNYNRVRRGLSDDPICPRCNEEDETIEHLLRNCPVSTDIWNLLGDGASSNEFYTDQFHHWVAKNASNGSSISSSTWSMKFAITCWWLWRWRNNLVFGRASENPIDPLGFLNQQFETSLKAFDPHSLFLPTPGTSRIERYIRWSPPSFGWFLLSTDGASQGNPGPAGCGGIIRDDTGNFITAFAFSCGICTSMRAEMRAVVEGLTRARSLGFTKVLVNMDNLPCTKLINEDGLISGSLRPLVLRCKELVSLSGWTVKVEHVFREANRATDWLANAGVHSSTSSTMFDSPPSELRTILREDVLGVAFPRLVLS
ncbi:uncharacterized protein LOC141655501 [Silene latifolia]|uniref:uncharacterized protein LOC141655501 n=1 Tax=Silene latifolia TaxID=37657 RepID=UPI003D7798C1